jgi:hypothetical protein
MDKEHVKGAADKVAGKTKEVAGHATGNKKLETSQNPVSQNPVTDGIDPESKPGSQNPVTDGIDPNETVSERFSLVPVPM